MTPTKNQGAAFFFFFDLAKNNLPREESEEEIRPMDETEYFLWLLGISLALIGIRFLFFLLF